MIEECFALLNHKIRKSGGKKSRYELIMETYKAVD